MSSALSSCNIQITSLSMCTIVIVLYLTLALAHSNSTIDSTIDIDDIDDVISVTWRRSYVFSMV